MNNLIFALLLFCSFSLKSQEKITSINNTVGSFDKYHFINIDGDDYVIELDYLNTLSVYKKESNDLHFLHSRYFENLPYFSIYKSFIDRYFITENGNSINIYDFTTNEFKIFSSTDTDDEFSFSNLISNKDEVIISNYINGNKYLLNLTTLKIDTLDKNWIYTDINDNYFKVEANSQTIFLNRTNNDTIALNITKTYSGTSHFGDSIFMFSIGSSLNVAKINQKQISTVYESPDLIKSTIIEYNPKEKRYYCTFKSLMGVVKDRLVILNEDFKILKNIEISNSNQEIYPTQLNDYIPIIGSNLSFLNTITNELIEIPSLGGLGNYIALDERFFFYISGYQIFLFDSKEETFGKLYDLLIFNLRDYKTQYMDFGDRYLINMINNDEIKYPLIEVYKTGETNIYNIKDKNYQGITSYDILAQYDNGFGLITNYFKIENDFPLFIGDVLHIKGSTNKKINKFEVQLFMKYRVANSKYYWIEADSNKRFLCTEDDGQRVERLRLDNLPFILPGFENFNVQDFNVVDDILYFTESNSEETNVYRVNMLNSSTTIIGQLGRFGQLEDFVQDNYYYFHENGDIKVVNPEGGASYLPIPKVSLSFKQKFYLNEELFVFNGDQIYKIDGEEATLVTDINAGTLVTTSNNYALFSNKSNKYVLFDGVKISNTLLNVKSYDSNVNNLGLGIMSVSTRLPNNKWQKSYYNVNNNSLIHIDSSLDSYIITKAFSNGIDTFIIATDIKYGNKLSHIIKMEQNNSFNNILHTVVHDYNTQALKWVAYKNEVFLNFGDSFYILDSLNSLVPIHGLKGSLGFGDVYVYNGYFYFIAIGAEHGRQVYRVRSLSDEGLPSISQDININDNLQIYPNPTDNSIHIGAESTTFIRIDFIDSQGITIRSFQNVSGTIDVNWLPSGYYVVKTFNGTQYKMGRLIKI